jgi:hypothetical protein
MTAFFIFDGEGIACERVYFDTRSILRQLLAGAGPLTWLRAVLALARGRAAARSPELAP